MIMNEHLSNFLKGTNPLQKKIIVTTFYKFIQLSEIKEKKNIIDSFVKSLNIKGTILLAKEGINGTIAGKKKCILKFFNSLKKIDKFQDIEPNYSICIINPFLRVKIKLKKEIVTIGDNTINPAKTAGKYIEAKNWNEFIKKENSIIIDTRNNYEVSIGTFKQAINPHLNNFREFPKWADDNLLKQKVSKNTMIGMFCTGGIRCEKSTSYLKKIGYKNVFHLQGGILKYLEKVPEKESMWDGDCFVFDYRVSLNNELKQGNYEMCFACRMPLSKKDKKNKLFSEGKSCHHCHYKTSTKQKQRFSERQKQVLLSKNNNEKHIGPKDKNLLK